MLTMGDASIFISQTGRKRRAVGTDKATKEAQSERATHYRGGRKPKRASPNQIKTEKYNEQKHR